MVPTPLRPSIQASIPKDSVSKRGSNSESERLYKQEKEPLDLGLSVLPGVEYEYHADKRRAPSPVSVLECT